MNWIVEAPLIMKDNLVKIARYLKKQITLTLSCVSDDKPWCCNCFYIFDVNPVSFIITSHSNTRHGQIMQINPAVAGTITDQPAFIGNIKGVQFSGVIYLLTEEEEKRARQLFCQRYPIAHVMKAPMWQIMIDELKMTNNRLGFSHKTIWRRTS